MGTEQDRIKSDDIPKFLDLYRENDCPCERITTDERAVRGFADELNNRTNDRYRPTTVKKELERFRKDKKGTGGLPPIGRDYHGPRFKS